MPDFEKIIKAIEAILKLIFGDQIPPWIFRSVGYILLFAFVLLGIWGLLLVSSKIKKLFTEEFWPLFYNLEEKRRSARRQRFADHIESEIRRLNMLEEWRNYRFAELEAEVEAEGRRRALGIFPILQRTRSGLRRERSLSRALESSQERLILLEGAPGSGKSIALRYVAQAMARRAMKSRSTKSVVPIYINLKELERRPGQAIDRNLIYSFVLKSLNRVNDRDIEEFLEEEFARGLREGTWLFLFDSFDELPEVLSSTETDVAIRSYTSAISDFLHGMNQCRGIIASRQFRGPGQFGWPRFRILPLSEVRCSELIRKADLKPDLEKDLIGQLGMARHEIRSMASNPMFLGLLCEHIRTGNPFPENVHSVFETYIETRFTRDKERLWRRFKLEPKEVRAAAERLACCMAADPGLGLSPTRESLKDATIRLGLGVGKRFDSLLDALEYIKLARSETAVAVGESKPFTFAHRRFQEYFATCVVLREPQRVSPRELLTNARWRETAVAMCQTQPPEVLSPIIGEARYLLAEIVDSVSGLIDDPLEYILVSESTNQDRDTEKEKPLPEPFPWPSGVLHILGLLQDGFGSHLKALPDDTRMCAGRLVLSASSTGTLFDRKWGLEVTGIVPQPILLELLRDAFASQSQWLREVAYRQTARIGKIPEDIASWIRQALIDLAVNGRLRRERHATHAHLARLDKSAHFISVMRFLLWAPFVNFSLHAALFLTLLTVPIRGTSLSSVGVLILISALLLSFLSIRLYHRGEEFFFLYAGLWFVILGVSHIDLLNLLEQQKSVAQMLSVVTFRDIETLTLCSFVASWAPIALFSARTGQFTHPVWWLLMPISPLYYFGRNAKVKLRQAWSALPGLCLIALVGVIGLGAVFILIDYGMEKRPAVFSVIVGILFFILPVAIMLQNVFHWCKDWVRWRRWVQSHGASITGQELLESISHYHRRSFCIGLVRAVREQGLLIAAKDTEVVMEKLAVALEHAGIREILEDQVGSTPSESDFFELWLAEYTRKDKRRLSRFGAEFLDEVCMLLEQVRASRRDRIQ